MSFALATSAASAVGAKRAPVAGARLGKSANIPRRAMQSSVTRAAVGADEGAHQTLRGTYATADSPRARDTPTRRTPARTDRRRLERRRGRPRRRSSSEASHPNCAFRARKISRLDGHDGGRCFRFRRILRKETRRRLPRSSHARAGTFRFRASFFVYKKRVHDTPLASANAH